MGRARADRRPRHHEAGSAGISTFIVVMTVLAMIGIGVAGIRTFTGASNLQSAARAGARAAAIEHEMAAAQGVAARIIDAELSRAGVECENSTVSVTAGPGGFEPGGSVMVDLTCTVPYRGLFVPWANGPKTLRAQAIEPIDCLRGGGSAVVDDNCYLGG